MEWRNPKIELPTQNQRVWIMLQPHKDRGSLLESAMSIKIVCGVVSYSNDGLSCRVENYDELGEGGIGWYLKINEDDDYHYEEIAIAWLPVEDLPLPETYNES